jgi:hypothetical protein
MDLLYAIDRQTAEVYSSAVFLLYRGGVCQG